MKKLIYFTTGAILFLVFLAPAILALGVKLIPGNDQPGYSQTLGIYGKRDITQKFISSGGNLATIGTSIKNPNLANKRDIIFSLYDENMNIIRTNTINGLNVEDGDFLKFTFDPIPDSNGKTYYFNLSSPTAGSEDMIQVFLSQNPPSWIVEYNYDQKVYPGGIPIVIFYKSVSKIAVIKDIYSNLFSRLLLPGFHKP